MDESQLKTPSALGFRMPAEWYPHQATWLTWPKDPETWPDRVPQVEEIYLQMIGALTPHEMVNLLVDDKDTEAAIRERVNSATAAQIHFITFKLLTRGFATMVRIFLLDQTASARSMIGSSMLGAISTKS